MKKLLIFLTIVLALILVAPNVSFAQHRSGGHGGVSHSQSYRGNYNRSVGSGHGGTSHSQSYYGHGYGHSYSGHSYGHSYGHNYGHGYYHGHGYSYPYTD